MRRTLFEDDHDAFRESFRKFLDAEVVPYQDQWDTAGIVPRELFATAGRSGFLGVDIPEQYGGGGVRDFRFNAVIGEEVMACGAAGPGLGLTLHNDICLPYFLTYCNDEQSQRWLPGIASGELVTAIAMTEPGTGSDLASMSTTARREGDAYLVNGSKTFITNGINADLVITAVKTDPTQKHRGMSLLVLERGMAGFTRGRNLDKVGLHTQDTAELSFADVRVPVANLLGQAEGQGFVQLVTKLPQEGCRSPWPRSRRPGRRWVTPWPMSRSARRSASRSGRSRTPSSCSPRSPPRSTSPSTTSMTVCALSTPAS